MHRFDLDEARFQIQELTNGLLQEQRANVFPPKEEVEARLKRFYRSFAEQDPQFVWLANPWQLTYAPAFYTGYTRKQINIVDSQEKSCRQYRDLLVKEIGQGQFDVLFESIWGSPAEVQIRTFPGLVNAEIQLLERERIVRSADLHRQFSERLMSKVYRNGLTLETSALSRIGNQISWFSIEHFTGRSAPWAHMSTTHRIAFDANFNWDGTPLVAPDAIPPGMEWGHLFRLRQILSIFADRNLNLCPSQNIQEELRAFEQLASSIHAIACFPEVCFISEPPTGFNIENGRFHSEIGPAITYADGFEIFCWKGVRVPFRAIELEPTLYGIESEINVEVTRVLIERYGYERYLADSQARMIDEDKRGSLYAINSRYGEVMSLLVVTNSTQEPDGSFKKYFLQVPPGMRTAQEAVAWTFSMNAEDYEPATES